MASLAMADPCNSFIPAHRYFRMTPPRSALFLLLLLLACCLAAGCTIEPEDKGPAFAPETTTSVPAAAAPILIKDPKLQYVDVEFEATTGAKNPDSIIIKYTLDGTRAVGPMAPGGFDIRLTGFVYNIDAVPENFNPQSYDDVIGANIPYKTARLMLYSTQYPGFVEPEMTPDRTFDLGRPWNYGLVLVVVG
jgi:hypothetical protein